MTVFVSYSRRDNTPEDLARISHAVRHLGHVYIDDLQPSSPALRPVIWALRNATEFIAVLSPSYLTTPWTTYEFLEATRMRIPIGLLDSAHYRASNSSWALDAR
jgi:hypothetical protein